MEKISQSEFLTIIKSADAMLKKSDIFGQERGLIKKWMTIAQVSYSEINKGSAIQYTNVKDLSHSLRSKTAKRLLLLVTAAIAIADKPLDNSEELLISEMTDLLDVGQLKLETLTFKHCEAAILNILSKHVIP